MRLKSGENAALLYVRARCAPGAPDNVSLVAIPNLPRFQLGGCAFGGGYYAIARSCIKAAPSGINFLICKRQQKLAKQLREPIIHALVIYII